VSDEDTVGVLESRGESRRRDRRRRAQQQCVSGGLPDQLGEQPLLEFDPFGAVLLDDVRVQDGFGDVGREVDAVGEAVGVQALGGQVRGALREGGVDGVGEIGARVAHADGQAVGGEQCRPGQADGARADDGGGTELVCHRLPASR
jgi:hypothetical protein